MQSTTVIILSSAAAGLLAVGTIGYLVVDDPDQQVDSIELTGVTSGSAPGANGAAASEENPASTQSVDGLEQLVGELRADGDGDGDDPDDWSVSGVEVDFGPEEWLLTAPELEDFDGNGTVEPLLDELRGLEGGEVTLGVRYEADDDRDDADVYTVNGLAFRDTDSGPAPWQSTGERTEADRDTVSANAAEAVGEGARTVEVERQDEDGWDGWDAEVLDAGGQEYEVILDVAGEVVDVRAED